MKQSKSWRQVKLGRERARELFVKFWRLVQKAHPGYCIAGYENIALGRSASIELDAIIEAFKIAPKQARRFTDAAIEILKATAVNTAPALGDIETLRSALNRRVQRLS